MDKKDEQKIQQVTQKILQLLDRFKVDNDGQKVTQWNMLALRAAIESELKKLEGIKDGS